MWGGLFLLFTCKMHVTRGLKKMNVPHVKRIHHRMSDSCYFCSKKADYKLFYSLPFYRLFRKRPDSLSTEVQQRIVT
jgi:hypothetical protein